MNKKPTAKYVKQWANAGFQFIKLRKRSKEPVDKVWGQHLHDADAITEWIERGGNYGIVIPPKFLILDADSRSQGSAKFKKYREDHDLDFDFATVPEIRTGGYDKASKKFGRHFLFRKDPEVAVVAEDETYGLEWRSSREGTQGRYIVGAGSIHPDGHYYKPLNDVPPADAPLMPRAMLDKIAKKPKNADGSEIVEAGKHSAEELERMLSGLPVEEFNSDSTWWGVLCSSHYAVASSDEGKQVFLDWCEGDSAYSHAREENEARWDSLSTGAKETEITVATLYKLLYDRDRGDLIPRDVMADEDIPGHWPHEIDYSDTRDASVFGKRFLRHRPSPILTSQFDDIYSYDSALRLWVRTSDRALKSEIGQTDQNTESLLSGQMMGGMIDRIRTDTYTLAMPGEWIRQPEAAPAAADLIPFTNGLLNRVTGKILPYTSDFFVTARAEYEFDPAAKCPAFDSFLESSLDPEFHDLVFEWLGYNFYGAAPAHAIFVLSGATRAGKSTLMNIAAQLVGPSAAVTVEINNFGSDFGLSETPGKRLILVPDAHRMHGNSAPRISARLKQWSGGDTMQINRKNEKLINIVPTGKIAIGCNEQPRFIDESGALAQRYQHIQFTRSFAGKEDRDLPVRLVAELPGIANRALEGLQRLESNGWNFTVGKKGKALATETRDVQQIAGRFARDCGLEFTGSQNDRILRDKAFKLYLNWCDDENLYGRERQNKTDFVNSLVAASQHKAKESLLVPTDSEKSWLRENEDESKSPHRKVRILCGVADPDDAL